MIRDIVERSRSCRRFHQEVSVDLDTLKELADLGRLSPSQGNSQPLRYVLSCNPEKNALIFSYLGWAGHITDWSGPPEGERPSAYVVLLNDKEVGVRSTSIVDHYLATQSILLGATEKGLAGCIMGGQSNRLAATLGIPDQYEILQVIALGKRKEKVVIDEIEPDGDTRYWRDEEGVHHVPKRRLEDIIIG